MKIGNVGIMKNDLRVGGMVRLVNPPGSSDFGPNTFVSVYFCEEDISLKQGRLPVNTIGLIIQTLYNNSVFHVLVGDRTILTSDTYIKPYHGEELFMEYADYEGYISDMEPAE